MKPSVKPQQWHLPFPNSEAIYLPTDEEQRMALKLRELSEALIRTVATVTGLPPEVVYRFVEGTTTGAVAAGKSKKGKRMYA